MALLKVEEFLPGACGAGFHDLEDIVARDGVEQDSDSEGDGVEGRELQRSVGDPGQFG